MAFHNIAKMTTATTGTGTITLGSAVSSFLDFASAGVVDGETVSYAIEDGTSREVGRGVYSATGPTLTRAVESSTNGNAAISLSGNALVYLTAIASDFGGERISALGTVSSGTATLDVSAAGWFEWTVGGNHSVAFTGWPASKERRVRAKLRGAANHTISWPAAVKWDGGSAPAFTPASGGAPDVSTATYASKSLSVTAEDAAPLAFAFSSDGTKMYVAGNISDTVYQYTLSTAWDVSTGSYASKSKAVGTQDTGPNGLAFSSDGTKMYMLGFANDTVYQYTLSTAWDVSTASYASKAKAVGTQDTTPSGMAFSSDGSKMYVSGDTNNTIYQYTLSTAWDVSTASYASKSVSVASQDATPTGIAFSSDGTKMYFVGNTNDTIYQYTMSTAWDISTATYASKSKAVGTQDADPKGVAFSSDGTKMYMLGFANDTVYQYSVSLQDQIASADILEFDSPDSGTTIHGRKIWAEA